MNRNCGFEGIDYVTHIDVGLPLLVSKRIDELRGKMSRSRFIVRILEMALELSEHNYYLNQKNAMRHYWDMPSVDA